EVTLRLREQPGLRVRLVLPPGEAAEGLMIRVMPAAGDAPPTIDDLYRSGLSRQNSRSAEEGSPFVFAPLAPGEYWILAVAGRSVRRSVRAVVGDGLVEQDLVLAAPDRADYALVWVEGPDGKPVQQVHFTITRRAARGSYSASAQAVRQADGAFRVPLDLEDGDRAEEDARYMLEARSPVYGAKAVPVTRGAAPEARIRFEAPGRLQVTLSGLSASAPANRVEVILWPADAEGGGAPIRPGSGGTAVFEAVAPGAYDLVARNPTDFSGGITLAKVRVDVRSGDNAATLALPPLQEVVILVPAGSQSASLVVQDQVHTGRKRGRMEFSVPCASPLTFTAMVVNALLVRLRDADGPFARLGLRDGDLVVGIDGKEFESEEQMFLLMAGSQSKESVTFMVLRGGAVVSIPAALGTLMEGDPGGSLEPASR
ncbi:MAG: PDZ domain-containing protein, partial [Planctomycetes bacterium]|nr:PDZ domain-containing protein [Planctomycetota bacterium]